MLAGSRLDVGIDYQVNGNFQTSGQYYKESWLNFIEKSGLRETLLNIKAVGAEKTFSSHVNASDSPEGKISNAVLSEVDQSLTNKITVGSLECLLATKDQMQVNSRQAVTFDANLSQGLISSYSSSSNLVSVRSSFEASGLVSESGNLKVNDLRVMYPETKTTVFQDGNKAEVWIRDATLSEQSTLIFRDLRGQMSRLGLSLLKVSINGKQIVVGVGQDSFNPG